MKFIRVKQIVEYKGGNSELYDLMPNYSQNHDYIRQYCKIWHVLISKVHEMKALSVLEFGTREGYSTRLFAGALQKTGGRIYTVDLKQITTFEEKNVFPISSRIEEFYWGTPVDILYIDDWHNEHHLYYELETFYKMARVIMIHDVCLDDGLARAVHLWCKHNFMIYTGYYINECGLMIIEVEKSLLFQNEHKTAGEEGWK